jgi:hypothetical protein
MRGGPLTNRFVWHMTRSERSESPQRHKPRVYAVTDLSKFPASISSSPCLRDSRRNALDMAIGRIPKVIGPVHNRPLLAYAGRGRSRDSGISPFAIYSVCFEQLYLNQTALNRHYIWRVAGSPHSAQPCRRHTWNRSETTQPPPPCLDLVNMSLESTKCDIIQTPRTA